MRKIFFLTLLLFSFSYATEDVNKSYEYLKTDQNIIYLSYKNKPKRVYVKQLFKVELKAIVATDKFDKLVTKFNNANNIKILNRDNPWKWYNDNIYYNTFYFKVEDENATLPDISLILLSNSAKVAQTSINSFKPEIIKLKGSDIFSGVIAKDLKVIKYKTSKFDNDSNIVIIQMRANFANLRDFRLKNVIKDGIDSYKEDLPDATVFYFAILPNDKKFFEFTYFNLKNNNFKKLHVPLEIDKEIISTQLELNPKESKLSLYKNIFLFLTALVSLIVFLFRRKKVYIFIFLISIVLLLIYYNPFDSIVLKKGTKIRILPTFNTTIFYVTDRKIVAEKLSETKKYIKILLPNGKIGWIKKEDVN